MFSKLQAPSEQHKNHFKVIPFGERKTKTTGANLTATVLFAQTAIILPGKEMLKKDPNYQVYP